MNIYVGNLSPEVTEDELGEVFQIYGEVISVTIMDDMYIGSGQLERYAYVQMSTKAECKAAATNLQDKSLRGRIIKVIEALPLSNNGHTIHNINKQNKHVNLKTRQRFD